MNKENEFFPKDLDFEKLVKKAKKRSMIKMVLISLVITLIVITGLYFIGDRVMIMKMEKETDLDSTWNDIMGANIEEQGTIYNYSPTSATAKTKIVKNVGGVPIPWGEQEKVFTIFGTSRLITNNGASGSGSIEDERIPLYYQGERVVEFFHPQLNYKQIFDDRALLNNIDDNSVVEMAFSFNKGYSIEEVNQVFKEQLAWYWVDTFNKDVIKELNDFSRGYTILGFEAYGFQNTASNFISILEMVKEDGGNYQNDAEEIINNLTNQGKMKLEPQNLKIIGVVVTGKPSDLIKFNDKSMIRGATLGATTDQY
ncbi:anti sigma factor C-terminal domain-containing protein [Psychrobacillus sp. INOP01]|uniref:anti sigma factor C-terminal domain-containing protein n=1 Tax=Psychrobacillus sp. INOP01 TaxID=2829187 RepID=UPI001BA97963|nr:anti sigma factor C-terminal domain-containing protein [Psychrobacillus sp. INOP01]QUG41717.1 anti sigma factor C-terminal domain-containing protein [Psychrobacillus sp. INOP01]